MDCRVKPGNDEWGASITSERNVLQDFLVLAHALVMAGLVPAIHVFGLLSR